MRSWCVTSAPRELQSVDSSKKERFLNFILNIFQKLGSSGLLGSVPENEEEATLKLEIMKSSLSSFEALGPRVSAWRRWERWCSNNGYADRALSPRPLQVAAFLSAIQRVS